MGLVCESKMKPWVSSVPPLSNMSDMEGQCIENLPDQNAQLAEASQCFPSLFALKIFQM